MREIWKRMTEGWIGYITYAVLGIVLAYTLNFFLGVILHTDLPVVAVLSGSMSHTGNPCGRRISTPTFDNWWSACEYTYKPFNISKNEFKHFPFPNGFNIGDVPIIQGSKAYKVGDIIVYSVQNEPAPIIHRIVAINPDGSYQTKGDHNPGQLPYEKHVTKQQIHGKVVAIIPYIGWVKVGLVKLIGVG